MHTGIDLTPIWTYVNELIGLVLTGIAAWIVATCTSWLRAHVKFLNAETDNQLGQIVNRAAQNGVAYAQQKIAAGEADIGPISTGSALKDMAANYVVRHVPETLDKLGKTPQDVSDLIMAKLPVACASPAPGLKIEASEEAVTAALNNAQISKG